MQIRAEVRVDERAIDEVVRLAFQGREQEPALVRTLREGETYLPDLSLVAQRGGDLVGHVMFTIVELVPDDGGDVIEVLSLAPLSVHPDHQRHGIGKTLVDAGLRRCATRIEPFVVVLGSDLYYPKFGFVPASKSGVRAPFPVDETHFMLRALPAFRRAKPGVVRYPAAFDETT
jgi:putative acetyltransferase